MKKIFILIHIHGSSTLTALYLTLNFHSCDSLFTITIVLSSQAIFRKDWQQCVWGHGVIISEHWAVNKEMEWQLRLFPWFHKGSRTTCTRSPRTLTCKTSTYSWLNLPKGRRTTRSHWSKTLGRTGWNQSLLQLNLVLDPIPRNLLREWCILCSGPWCECAVLHLCRIGTHHHCFARSHKCDAICRH